ncbi:MAG: NAD(P)/FAD-dependent oxidoreductase [Bacteroidota bacterium]
MNRSEFLQKSVILGAGFPLMAYLLQGCTKEGLFPSPLSGGFAGKVLVIGAGAAGMTAAYLLRQQGVEVELLEASGDFGGRVKRDQSLADFPIDMGAEWIHTDPVVLQQMVNDDNVTVDTETIVFDPETYQIWKNEELKNRNWANNFYSEWKFKSTTWYGFFETYIVPSIQDRMNFNQPVAKIDYAGEKVVITTENGDLFEADRVIVTVPIKVLQKEMITFSPALPTAKKEAIDSVFMGDGLKVFMRFSERFYPDMLFMDGIFKALSEDDKLFYNIAFGKDSEKHVMGLFTINSKAADYTALESDQAILDAVLAELDDIFDGKATELFEAGIVQNWSKEPYIGGSYSTSFEGNYRETQDALKVPLDGKVYFAGEAMSLNQAMVHGAADSGYEAVKRLLAEG